MINAIIVDDENLIRDGLKVIINWEKLGVKIAAEASNGKDALDIIKKIRPQLAIVDIKMPILSGIELIEVVKKEGINTLFIILSGYDEFGFAQQAIKFGAFRYLLKPVEPDELESCLCEAKIKIKQQSKEQDIMHKCQNVLGVKAFESSENGKADSEYETNANNVTKNTSILKILKYINDHIEERLALEDLAKIVFMNPNYLSQLFKSEMNENLIDYIIRLKVEKAKELLISENLKLYEVAERVGYKDFRYFSHVFKKLTGFHPSECKNKSIT